AAFFLPLPLALPLSAAEAVTVKANTTATTTRERSNRRMGPYLSCETLEKIRENCPAVRPDGGNERFAFGSAMFIQPRPGRKVSVAVSSFLCPPAGIGSTNRHAFPGGSRG